MPISIKRVRDRTWHFLNHEVAACAGLSLQELQQFCAGNFTPTPQQIEQLARRIGVDHNEH